MVRARGLERLKLFFEEFAVHWGYLTFEMFIMVLTQSLYFSIEFCDNLCYNVI